MKRPPVALLELPSGWWTADEASVYLNETKKYIGNLFIKLSLRKAFKTGEDKIGRNCTRVKYYWPGFQVIKEECAKQNKRS